MLSHGSCLGCSAVRVGVFLGLASSWPGDCPTEVVEPTLRFITYHPESGSPEAALDHGRLEHRDWPVTRNWVLGSSIRPRGR